LIHCLKQPTYGTASGFVTARKMMCVVEALIRCEIRKGRSKPAPGQPFLIR
jgi:hypothetical protein